MCPKVLVNTVHVYSLAYAKLNISNRTIIIVRKADTLHTFGHENRELANKGGEQLCTSAGPSLMVSTACYVRKKYQRTEQNPKNCKIERWNYHDLDIRLFVVFGARCLLPGDDKGIRISALYGWEGDHRNTPASINVL